jgi:hypothetical protein
MYLASLTVIILAVSGLAIAQNPNPILGQGYYGQQAPAPAVAGSQTAQLHSHTAAATPIMMVRCCEVRRCSEVKKVQKEKNFSVPTAREGDPTASQNQVEYGGGGM